MEDSRYSLYCFETRPLAELLKGLGHKFATSFAPSFHSFLELLDSASSEMG